MPTPAEVWSVAAQRYSDCLQSAWDEIRIGGKTITEKWGLTRDTCARFSVGFVPLFDNFFEEVLREQFGIDLPALHAAHGFGLINISQLNFAATEHWFAGRIVFPYWKQGRIIYWSGRATDVIPESHWAHKSKMLHMRRPKGDETPLPLYLEPDPNAFNIIVEGQTQALRLRQEGFHGVACGGQISHAQQAELKRYKDIVWLPDVDVLNPTADVFDDKPNGRVFVKGQTTADKINSKLPFWREIPQLCISRYPQPFCEANPKGDANDWFSEHPDPREFLDILDQRLTLDQAEVEAISPYLAPAEKLSRIKQFLEHIHQRDTFETSPLLARLFVHLKLDKQQQTDVRRMLKKLQADGNTTPDNPRDFTNSSQYREMRGGQDFLDGKLYYTVWRKEIRTVFTKGQPKQEAIDLPYQVNSAGDFFPATESEMLDRRLSFPRDSAPSVPIDPHKKWQDAPETPFSLHNFLRDPSGSDPDTRELYEDILRYLNKYAYYDDPTSYDFVASFAIASYLVMIFGGVGILGLNGTKNSGKSRTMELLESIGFNPTKISSVSASFIYRLLDTSCCMFLWDEAEGQSSKKSVNDTVDDKSLILKDCYRKDGGVGRCVGIDSNPKKFRTFSTFCLGNTQGYESTLRSRMYFFPTTRAPKNRIEMWSGHRVHDVSASIRNRLHCWALLHAAEVAHYYDRLEVGDLTPLMDDLGLYNRDREIHAPLLAIALTIDKLMGDPFDWTPDIPGWQRPDISSTVGRLIAAIQRLTKLKHELLLADDLVPTFLAALRQAIRQEMILPQRHPNIADPVKAESWFNTNELKRVLHRFVGLKYFPKKSGPNSLKFFLRDKVPLLLKEDITRWRTGKEQPTFIRIDMKRLDDICRVAEVDDDAWIELEEETESAATPSLPLEEEAQP